MVNALDLIGRTFGRLTVKERIKIRRDNGKSAILWICVCDCGSFSSVPTERLTSGETRSCGCLAREGRPAVHGGARKGNKSAEYKIWCSMKDRCLNPKNEHWDRYGGRGISVCEEWINDFAAFRRDMGPRTSPAHSIDRVENDGNYEKNNCRWATKSEQALNRSKGVRPRRALTLDGRTAHDLSEASGIAIDTIRARWKLGYREEDLTAPSLLNRRRPTGLGRPCNSERDDLGRFAQTVGGRTVLREEN